MQCMKFSKRFARGGVSPDRQRCTSAAVLKSVSQIESPETSLFQIRFIAIAVTFFMQTNQILIL